MVVSRESSQMTERQRRCVDAIYCLTIVPIIILISVMWQPYEECKLAKRDYPTKNCQSEFAVAVVVFVLSIIFLCCLLPIGDYLCVRLNQRRLSRRINEQEEEKDQGNP